MNKYQALTEELSQHRRQLVGGLYRHMKTGGTYQVEDVVFLESDMKPLVIYFPYSDDETDVQTITFARPMTEFLDGRFECIGKVEIE